MPQFKEAMDSYLCETVSFPDWLLLRMVRRQLYFNNKTLLVRFVEGVLKKYGVVFDEGEPLTIGALQHATGLRQKAYASARNILAAMNIPTWKWGSNLSTLFGIRFSLVVEKYFFDELYRKFIFIDLALAYRKENPEGRHFLILDAEFLDSYVDQLNGIADLRVKSALTQLVFLTSFLVIPLLPFIHRWRHGVRTAPRYQQEIICHVDDRSTYDMFRQIFASKPNLRFVVERQYALTSFREKELSSWDISVLGFSASSYRLFLRACLPYMRISLECSNEIGCYGGHHALIFFALLRGKSLALEGDGNLFVCFEHLTTVRAIRNEFLEASGNRTLFVPKNSYVTYQHFHSEIFANYTFAGAAGPHALDVYRSREARAETYIATGSYDCHRALRLSGVASPPPKALRDFKGDFPLVVFLSPGVCAENYSHDKRLIELAGTLAKSSKAKVIVRLKPVDRIKKYQGFYEAILSDAPNVLLTGQEYDLFDFLGVGDLFVTSQSTSACDLAVAGAQVMFVDFMKTPDLYAPWEKVPSTVFSEEVALGAIMAWIDNAENERLCYADKVRELSTYLGYVYKSFESYQDNLLKRLEKVFPNRALINAGDVNFD